MFKYIKMLLIVLSSLVLMSCNTSNKMEDSFSIVAELCKANFAPSTKDEYMDVYNKYKNKCIDEQVLTTFFDIGKEVHTNVMIINYNCRYIKSAKGNPEYHATMRVGNGELYSDIKVRFIVNNHKIVNVVIEANNE